MRLNEFTQQQELDEFQLNPTGAIASIVRWAVENPAIIAALGAVGAAGAVAATSGMAALAPLLATVTSINAGQGALGLYTLDKLKELVQNNPSQAESYIKKLIYKYIGDQQDVREFEQIHSQTAYKGETEFRWRAEVWPVTLDKNAAESWLEKNDRYWLDNYNKEQADKEQSAAQQKPPAQQLSQQELASTVPAYIPPTRPTESVGDNYHANRTGFRQGQRDDERHDLDVARPLIYGLKINGKIWQKDGNTVTFFTKERALAARNSILAKRPELEVGLVQRPQD